MTNILSDGANNIIGKLIDLLTAESRNVCCFKCIVEDFEKEKEGLEAKWRTVGKEVEDARSRVEDIRDDVIHWQEQAENLIKEDTKASMACFGGWCPNCIWRYRKGKELAEKADDIRRLRGTNFESVGHAPHLPGVEYHSSQGFIHFKSRDLGYHQLLDALADDTNYMIGLQGMGGCGKTTLAKQVGKELLQSKKFDHVIFATVSTTPDVRKIQDSIAGPLGLSLKDKNEWERPKILWKRLIEGEKILIILDDAWERINFEDIGIPSGDDHKNCKVLLTTRDVRVCSSMGCPRPIQLGLLLEEDAWVLFKKHAGIKENSSRKLQGKGREITKECKGLPIAIAAIASTLKDQPPEEWNAALIALRNPVAMHDVNENLLEIYKCLRYSYDNMKSEKAKRLFLLLSVLPENVVHHKEVVTRYGLGVGLFGEADKYNEARSQALVAINKLIDSCLLLEDDEGWVQLHDLVREVALWIANEEVQVIKMSDKNRSALAKKEKNVRYLCCDDLQVGDMDVFPNWFDGTKLEMLIIYIEASDYVKVPNAFFEKMTRLQVLDMTPGAGRFGAGSMLALSLPFSIQSLTNIRFLGLDSWKLGDISILGTLRSLETLVLFNCSISELPNKITELEKLRLLSLAACEIERNNPFEVIERCLPLEELYYYNNVLSIVDSVNEAEAIHQNRRFPALNRYIIQRGLYEDSTSKCVCLPCIDALISEATFKYLVQGAEILWLREIKGGWRNLIPEVVPMEDEGMNDLVELALEYCSKIQCLVNTKHIDSRVLNLFPKLVALKLESLDNLEELCSGSLPFEFLRSLERLHIEQCEHLKGILFKSKLNLCSLKIMKLEACPMLASLFQLSTARSLVLLEELIIRKCERLTNIITDERSEGENKEGDNDHWNSGSMFPKLRNLEIESCHRLEFILSALFPQALPLLETIKIVDCDQLKHIFGRYQHQHEDQDVVLGSLQKMELSGLSTFLNIYQECYPPMSSFEKRSSSRNGSKSKQSEPSNSKIFPWSFVCCYHHKNKSKLRSATSIKMPVRDELTDTSIPPISNSECLHSVGSARCPPKHSQGLNMLIVRNIRVIELKDIEKIKFLFILSSTPSMMLEILRIEACPRLTRIVDIGDDTDGKNWDAVFPNLKELSVCDCGQLEYMFGLYPLDHQNYNEVRIHLPALEKLTLHNLLNFISTCPKNSLSVMWPSLKEFDLNGCPLFTVTSISDFMVDLDTRQLDRTTAKELGALVTYSSEISNKTALLQAVQNVEKVILENSKIEGILQLPAELATNRKSDLLTSRLRELNLVNLPGLIYICKGPIQSMSLPNLERVMVYNCNNLKFILSSCIAGGLPQLKELNIEDCGKLEQILQDDENQEFSDLPMESCQPEDCPKSTSNSSVTLQMAGPFNLCNLERLILRSCPELRSLFSPSTARSLSSLEELWIEECHGLRYLLSYDRAHKNKVEPIHEDHDSRRYVSMFPRLRSISVKNCNLLEYIFHVSFAQGLVELKDIEIEQTPQLRYAFGQSIHDSVLSSHQGQNKIRIKLPILEKVSLVSVPNMINICPDSYYATCSSLLQLSMNDVGLSTLSINNLMVDSEATHLDLSFTMDIGVAGMMNGQLLGSVNIWNSSKIEGVFHLEGFPSNGRQVITSWLTDLSLINLPQLSYIWKGAKHFVCLQHLYKLHTWGCPKLKAIFSASVLRSLPLLKILVVELCEELEQIIEKDEENENVSNSQSPNICFSRLKLLIVTQCNKLKRLFYISRPHEFPELEYLIVNQNSRLEEVFEVERAREGIVEVLVPELNYVVLMQLPNLNHICQGIDFQNLSGLLVHGCPKLSLTSTATAKDMLQNYYHDFDIDLFVRDRYLIWITEIITQEAAMQETTSPILTESTKAAETATNIKVPASEIKNKSTQDRQHLLLDSNLPPIPSPKCTEEIVMATVGKDPVSEIKDKSTQGRQDLLLDLNLPPIPLRNLTESTEEIDTTNIGRVPASVKPALPTADSELSLATPASLATRLHKMPPRKLGDQESTSGQGFLDEQHALGETINIEDTVKESVQEGICLGGAVAKNTKSSNEDMFAQDAQVVEQGDKLNESDTRTSPCQKIQNGVDSIPKGFNLMDSNDSIVAQRNEAQRNEEQEKEFIGKVSISEIPAIVTSPIDSELVERPSPNPLDIPPQTTYSNGMVDGLSVGEPRKTKKQKPLGKTESTIEIPQSEIRLSQTETGTDKDSEDHPINIQDFGGNDLTSSFLSVEGDGDGQIPTPFVSETKDNLVVKVLADLEESLRMPLKDIACSEANSLRLLTALNFLSRLPLEDVTLSARLKAIIDSLHQEFPSILCSFKQAFASTNKFAVPEAAVVSKISKAKNFMDEAQQKEAILKEHINMLEKERKECEAELSSLQEEKKKCVTEIVGYKKELETVWKDKSQMVEEQRKARQELFEVDYKWSALCSQFEHYCIAGRNPS